MKKTTLFFILLLFLFALLALPSLASEPKAPLPPSIPQMKNYNSVMPQITFTPVVTIYLPIVLGSGSSEPPPAEGDSYEPDNTATQANSIQNGETQTHSIVPETDSDWVKFTVNSPSQLLLEASDVRGDLELRFYDSGLNELDYSYSWTDSPAQIKRDCGTYGNPLPPGTYYAKIEHWLNSAEIDSYDISLTTTPCPTLSVLANSTNYVWYGINYLAIIGEVQNDGIVGVSGIDLVVNLFTGSGQLIDTSQANVPLTPYSWYSALAPGDKTCFIAFFDTYSGWVYYRFEEPTYSEINEPLENMTVYGDSGTYLPIDKDYRVLGFVRNDNSTQVNSTNVIVTLYGLTGNPIDCEAIWANTPNLAPGQSTSFEHTFSRRDDYDVGSYRTQVGGELQ